MKRVAIYIRVSTEEQKKHGMSVDNQLDALKKYCSDNNYTVAGIFNDAGISARKPYKKRPALLNMIDACQNKKVDLVIFTKLDRFFRSVPDYYACVEQMNGVPWRAIWEDYETETSAGMFKVNIMLSIAQAEADRTSERIKAVNSYRREQGQYINGRAPVGYKAVNSQLVKDEAVADKLQRVFDHYAATYSTAGSVDLAHSLGLTFARETFTRMLKNPTYSGDAYGYKCDPYISVEQYNRNLSSVTNNRCRTHTPARQTIFTGILVCSECGRNLCSSNRKFIRGSKEYNYRYYRCVGHRNRICSNKRTVTEMLVERTALEALEPALNKYNYELTKIENIGNVDKKIAQLESKLRRIGDRYEEGDITKEEYKTKRNAILTEIDTLKNQINNTAPKTLPADWKEVYQQLDKPHKKAFWRSICKKIIIYPDKELKVDIIL